MNKLTTAILSLTLAISLSACMGNATKDENAAAASNAATLAGANASQAGDAGSAAAAATQIMQHEGGVAAAATEMAMECAKYYAAKEGCAKLGGFKAMTCKAGLKMKFKNTGDCPKK